MRGDVVWVRLPSPSVPPSHVQAGPRPAVVLQSDSSYHLSTVVVVVPGTSQSGATRLPHTVHIAPTTSNGLAQGTYFLGNQVRAVDKRIIGSRMGALSVDELRFIEDAVRSATGL